MPRIGLKVPYAKKDEAKKLGARWDNKNRVWYVPDGLDVTLFSMWLMPPNQIKTNFRSRDFYVAESFQLCWRCGEKTRVYCFALPQGCESLGCHELEDDSKQGTGWEENYSQAFVYNIDLLNKNAFDAISSLSKKYYSKFQEMEDNFYYGEFYHANHCECCSSVQGDEFMHHPGNAFAGSDSQQGNMIFHWFDLPFEAHVGIYSWFFITDS